MAPTERSLVMQVKVISYHVHVNGKREGEYIYIYIYIYIICIIYIYCIYIIYIYIIYMYIYIYIYLNAVCGSWRRVRYLPCKDLHLYANVNESALYSTYYSCSFGAPARSWS